jgi:Phosphoesterase family
VKTVSLSMICLAILVLGVFASSTTNVNSTGTILASSSGRFFDYVVIIMLENHGINTTYGNACLGNCSFFNSFANTNGLAEQYDAGGVSGSLGDYIAITSGDGSVVCNSAPSGSCGPYNDVNIVDRIEKNHLTWKAYMEDYPGSGTGSGFSTGGCFISSSSGSGHYASIHNPFVYYQDIVNSTRRCSRIVPANSVIPTQTVCGTSTNPGTVETDDLLLKDLNSVANVANYSFLTPNTFDDLHDCGDVSQGNHYLELMVPQILNSTLFKTKRAALFVTFDEVDPFAGAARDMYTVWASNGPSLTKAAYKSTVQYNHYYALRTVLDNWRLSSLNSTTAGLTYNMGEFFR